MVTKFFTMKKVNLLDELLAITTEATVKGRGASGKLTYLDRFVTVLTDADGVPTEPKSRQEIIMLIAHDITMESNPEFDVKDPEQKADFIALVNKVKHQVAAAVSDSNNSTALSYNAKYKDKYEVVKEGKDVSLAIKEAGADAADETKDESASE